MRRRFASSTGHWANLFGSHPVPQIQKTTLRVVFMNLAERTGFEPAKALRPYTLSKRAPSTTRTPLQLLIF